MYGHVISNLLFQISIVIQIIWCSYEQLLLL